MLKKGEIIAVDTTPNLLKKHASQTLSLQLNGVIPDSLKPLLVKSDIAEGRFVLRLDSPSAIEGILSACRKEHLDVLDCSIEKPDLEDVFVQMMSGGVQ
jgi:ABC-2 type transport system ATP-binding protein